MRRSLHRTSAKAGIIAAPGGQGSASTRTAPRLCGVSPRGLWDPCLAVVCKECGGGSMEQEQRMAPVGFFDVLVLAIGGHFLVKIITTWLKTREGVTKRQGAHLGRRPHALGNPQVAGPPQTLH